MPTIIDGTTGVDQIQDGTVTEAKIADGAVTAAKLAPGVISTNSVLAATAGASVGAVGTYAFLSRETTTTAPGDTVAGSQLNYRGALSNVIQGSGGIGAPSVTAIAGAAPAGTWLCMGRIGISSDRASSNAISTLWLRIS